MNEQPHPHPQRSMGPKDTGDSCDDRQECLWCGVPLDPDPESGDQLRPWAQHGCCAACLELE